MCEILSPEKYHQKSPILNLDRNNLTCLSRIDGIGGLIKISEGTDIEGDKTVLNDDTVIVANFILKSIKDILGLDPNNIKTSKIANVTKKIGRLLIERGSLVTGDLEDYKVGLLIQNISLQIENTHLRLERKLNNAAAETDVLTNLANRRKLDFTLTRLIALKNRNDTAFSILLIDIDNFKQINDKYSHLTGDQALKNLAQLLTHNFRQYDVIGRWGGEEFMIILPETNIIIAAEKAEKIRGIIEKLLSESIDEIKDNITVSIGVTQVEKKRSSPEIIIGKADFALYVCKNNGKNRVSIQIDSPETTCDNCEECTQSQQCIYFNRQKNTAI